MAGGNQKIGKYDIVSELGRGAMGVVYKGLDPVINRYVAIKTVIRQGGGAEAAELAERFKQEAQAAGRLNHPAVVGVYDYGEDGDQAYIVMEFVDGSTLSELSKYSGVFDLESIIDLMVKVLDGLNFAHSKGIVHRDIKPSNIMRTADGEVKITDFGIARIESSELTQIGTVIGTPGYMSPEQLMGQRVDHRSDVFSCGILLYELLTGERAFASTNVTSTIYKVVHTELPPVSKICPTVPAAMDPVLARALAKNPADRYQSAQEFAQALEAALRTAPAPAVAGPAPEEERTLIRAPQLDDQGTVVASGNSRTDDTGGVPASHADGGAGAADPLRESPLREAPAPVPTRNSQASTKVVLGLVGAVVVGIAVAAVTLLHGEGGGADKAPAVPQVVTSPHAAEAPTASAPAARTVATTPGRHKPGDTFRDCEACPDMVVVAPGSFVQGSPDTESDREPNEGPQHTVKIAYPLAVGRYEVTRGEFAQFAGDTGYEAMGCWVYDGGWRLDDTASWRSPGFVQTDDHPATCISWQDAEAYVRWLSKRTGKRYRLLTSSEWEYIARAGSTAARAGGDGPAAACSVANVADRSAAKVYQDWKVHGCQDGYIYTAPVGKFKANKFGVYDMSGNVFEWVQDCWNSSYQGAPTDGSAWTQGDCGKRVLRGASWFSMPRYDRFAFRNHFVRDRRSATFGFRVARRLPGS